MEEDALTRYVWICLLVLADKEGFIDMTAQSIARTINIDEKLVRSAINKFCQPDKASRTPEDDGRRLEPIRSSFGWRVINYVKYSNLRDSEHRREQNKEAQRRHRERVANKKLTKRVSKCQHVSAMSAHVDTDTDTDTNTDTDSVAKTPQAELVNYFSVKFKQKTGKEYIVSSGKDYKLAFDLLKCVDLSRGRELVDNFFNSTDKFILDAGYTFGVFISQINKLQSVNALTVQLTSDQINNFRQLANLKPKKEINA